MNITPRKDEYQAVVDLLESDQYDSAASLAKAIIKTVYDVMLERDWFISLFAFASGDPTIAWGPFSSDNEAEKYAQKLALPGPARLGVLKVHSPSRQRRAETEQIKKAAPVFCLICGHPGGLHEHDGRMNNCQFRGCDCRYLKKAA